MIDKMMRAMCDTGLIDGMSLEDLDTLATAALEGMREPTFAMIMSGQSSVYDGGSRSGPAPIMVTTSSFSTIYKNMIDAALNE